MKAKVSRGEGARGAVDYILDQGPKATGDKRPEIVGGTCSATSAPGIAREIGSMKNLRPDAKRHVWHCSLALPAGERLDAEQWDQIARAHLENMGIDPDSRPWIAVRHGDTSHDHIHILTSRIGFDKQLWHGKWEARRAIESTQELEQRFGLTLTAGLGDANSERKQLTGNEIQQSARTGEAPARAVLQEIVAEALTGGPQSVLAFVERIEAAGAKAIPNIASTGKMNGFAFEYESIRFKASDLGKGYAWKNLIEKGVQYEQDRDSEALSAIRERAIKASDPEPERAAAAGGPDSGSDGSGEPESQPAPNGNSDPYGRRSRDVHRLSEGGDQRYGEPDPAISESAAVRIDQADESERSSEPERPTLEYPVEPDALDDFTDRLRVERDAWGDVADHIADHAAGVASETVADKSVVDLSTLRPDHRAKIEAWREQHDALQAPEYRLTLVPREHSGKPWVMGKKDDGEEFFTPEQVESMIPQLRGKNARGWDIYITPIDPENHYILIDDANKKALNQLINDGFKPCIIQKSSTDNHQVVIKIPKGDSPDEQKVANKLCADLNRQYGDLSLSGAVHPFRMAGFSNRKPGRRKTFTKVIEAAHRVCDLASRMLGKLRHSADQARDQAMQRLADLERQQRLEWIEKAGDDSDPIGLYRAEFKRQLGLAQSKNWALDDSALDYRTCKALLKIGMDRNSLKDAIREASPGLMDRHKNPDDYINRTISSAQSAFLKEQQAREAQRPVPGYDYNKDDDPRL